MRILYLFCLIFPILLSAQDSAILERLVALENNNKTWYNIDGYSVTSEKFKYDFNDKGIKKVLRKHKLNKKVKKSSNAKIDHPHFIVKQQQNLADSIIQKNNYYFLEGTNKKIWVIWFATTGKVNEAMEIELTNLIAKNAIPERNFVSMQTDVINFGNRDVLLGNHCYWTFLNTVQCPYQGEMNWSVHHSLASAQNSVENQFKLLKSKKSGKIISDEFIDITFEEVPTKARKVVYDLSGVSGVLAGMSGGKTLTIYYVAEKVRGHYMSCVLSHWNNDVINSATNLPPLLEKVMTLEHD